MRRELLVSVAVLFVACGGTAVTSLDDAGTNDAGASDGSVTQDGSSSDGAPDSRPPVDGGYACSGILSSVDPSFAACGDMSDCSFVLGGCYCGDRPALGVSSAFEAAAEACETHRSDNCALGCASGLDVVAQDGKITSEAGAIAVRCEVPPDGGPKQCLTYVP